MTKPARIGQTIDGRYVLVRFIGQGGMGAVYEARDEGDPQRRRVAIKFVLVGEQNDARRARFVREARLAGDVSHPNVVRVLGHGGEYLVMELVEGTDLERLLASSPRLAIERVISIIRALLAGLQAIHERGIVHRDVKPSNVFVTEDVVKLGDFGLARSAQDVTLTATGHVVGTTPYLAPEVFRGDETDHRADLYAVGVTLYHMLAGRLPFAGATAELGAQHVYAAPPPITDARPDVPRWLVAVVERALAKAPSDRFASAADFIAALDARADVEAARSRGGARRRTPRWPYVLAVVVVLAGAALGAYLARSTEGSDSQARDAGARSSVDTPALSVAAGPIDAGARIDAEATDVGDVGDVRDLRDAGVDAAVGGAGRHGEHAPVSGKCSCMPAEGPRIPLCPQARAPRCRCMIEGGWALCPRPPVTCDPLDERAVFRAGMKWELMCPRDFRDATRCPDLTWMSYVQEGRDGEACAGYTVNYGGIAARRIPEGERRMGRWECDSCAGVDTAAFGGVEGRPCQGYSRETGEAVTGVLEHCD